VPVSRVNGKVRIGTGRHAAELDHATAAHVFVTAVGGAADVPRLRAAGARPGLPGLATVVAGRHLDAWLWAHRAAAPAFGDHLEPSALVSSAT
jgi:hypothetical protein